jgi:hypothetical protein
MKPLLSLLLVATSFSGFANGSIFCQPPCEPCPIIDDCIATECDDPFDCDTFDPGKPSSWFCPDHAGIYPEFLLPPHRWPVGHPAKDWEGPLEPGAWGPREIFGPCVFEPWPPPCVQPPSCNVPEPSSAFIFVVLAILILTLACCWRNSNGR